MALRFTRLDRLTIRKLQPGQTLTEHGITFERLPNGDGRYTVNVMVDGVRIHRVIGKESEGVTRQQAEDFIEQARTEARKGRLNLPKGRKVVLGFTQKPPALISISLLRKAVKTLTRSVTASRITWCRSLAISRLPS